MLEQDSHSMRRLMLAVPVVLVAALAFGQPSEDATRKKLVDVAFKYRGVPYVYGAESPAAFDCSGFVRYVYREAFGLELPRSARGFYSAGTPIDWKAAKMGDVFIYDTVGGAPSHVSIAVGDGTVIHAVSDGPRTGVILSPMTDRYWEPRLIAARTFFAAGGAKVASTPPAAKPVVAIVDIGFVIPAEKKSFTDRIPTATGTSVAFTLTNGTGKDGTFMVLFFRIDPKTFKLQQIHEEKVRLAANAAFSLPPYNYDKPGKYKLVVKDSWGNQLFEREFMVESAGT